jgi:putative addiction module component (TIGR02574 family)
MSKAAKKLLEQALKLDEGERIALIASIGASLSSQEADAEWAEELSARAEDMMSGKDRGFSMEETLAWAATPSRK